MSKAVRKLSGGWNCLTTVWDGMRRGQCAINAKYDPDENGNPTKCHIHSKAGIEKRAQKQRERDAAWRAQWSSDMERRRINAEIRAVQKEALEACRKIAAGHNDPRSLAAEVIAKLPPEADE